MSERKIKREIGGRWIRESRYRVPKAYVRALGAQIPRDMGTTRSVSLAEARDLAAESDFVRSFVLKVLSERTVDPQDVARLDEYSILGMSTVFRSSVLFPGETVALRYRFDEKGQRRMGFLGFDENNGLISIDERRPERRILYRQGEEWVPKDATRVMTSM